VLIHSRTKTTAGKARSFAPTCRIAGMKWIKRERINIDRVGCRWLIRNLLPPEAEFVPVPHDTVYQIAERELIAYHACYAECQRKLKSEPLE
jgi:hypothetical protein